MNRKFLFTLSLFLGLGYVSIHAQKPDKTPKTIGILPFKYADPSYRTVALQAESFFYEMLVNSKRAIPVEREFFKDLEDEKWRQSSEDFIDGSTISKTSSRGAQDLTLIRMVSYQVEEIRNKENNSITYYCNIVLNLRIVDVETSQVKHSYTLKNPTRNITNLKSWYTEGSKVAAEQRALKELKRSIEDFLNDYLPLEASILEIVEENKGKAKVVLIEIGTDQGAKKGDEFTVLENIKRQAGGKEISYTAEIGEIEIKETNGPNISTALVKKGSDKIFEKFSQGGSIIIKSKT